MKTPKVMSLRGFIQKFVKIEGSLGDLQSLKHDDVVEERDDDSEREGLHNRKHGKQDEVPWMRVTLPEEKSQGDESTKSGEVESPRAVRMWRGE